VTYILFVIIFFVANSTLKFKFLRIAIFLVNFDDFGRVKWRFHKNCNLEKLRFLGKSRDDFSFLENNKKLQILFSEVFCA